MSTFNDAASRVAEYVRQRDIAMSGGNVGDVIATIFADPESYAADLDVRDLRTVLAALDTTNRNIRELHRAADPDGLGPMCVHCTALADCDVRWPCRTVRALNPEHSQASEEGTTRWQATLER